MKTTLKTLPFLLLLLLVACHQLKEDIIGKPGNIEAAISIRNCTSLKLSNIFQPASNIVLGNINKILTYRSLYYLMDEEQGIVTILDNNGKLIREINRRGHGNNEYVDLNDIFIDKDNQELNLLSRGSQKIFVYDMKGETLLRTVSVPKHFCSMIKIDRGYVGYMGNYSEDAANPYNFFTLDENMKIKVGSVEINPDVESRYNKDLSIFSNMGNKTLCIQEFDSDIYQADGNQIVKAFSIDFEKWSWPKDQKLFFEDPIKQITMDAQYVKKLNRVQETATSLIFFYHYQGQEYMTKYDKASLNSTCYSLRDGVEDLFPASFGNVVGTNEECIISTINAKNIHDLYSGRNEHNDFDEMYKDKMNSFRSTVGMVNTDNYNPYIVTYSIEN